MVYANLLIAAAVGYAVFVIFLGLVSARSRDSVQQRFDHYGARVRGLEEIELEQSFGDRAFKPIARRIAALVLRIRPRTNLDDVRHRLDLAGNPGNIGAFDYIGIRWMSAFIFAAVPFVAIVLRGNLSLVMSLVYPALTGLLGYLLPEFWLRGKIRARQKNIRGNLPDALDLLTVSVEAGLTFEAAMARVAEYADDEVSRGFGRVLAELQLGVPRQEALRNMSERAEVPDLNNFATALIQAEQLGVGIAKVLRIQADEMRIKRRQRAEEMAQRAPVKMSIVLVLLLLPALFLVILGPSVPRICAQMSPGNRFCS